VDGADAAAVQVQARDLERTGAVGRLTLDRVTAPPWTPSGPASWKPGGHGSFSRWWLRPRLLVFGAGHTAEALVPLAAAAGFRVTVCDPRPALTVPEKYSAAAEVLLGWPDETVPSVAPDRRTYAVVLAHDPKIELPLLPLLLASPARYIGVLGSRKTHAARVERLTAEGWPAEQVERLHGPVGLDLGAVTPEEVAVSIVAQLVAVRRGRPAAG